MTIPGSNILNQALSIIKRQTLTYLQASGRQLNLVGQDVTKYLNPVSIRGSFQPIQKQIYEQLGLDLQKLYFNFYVSKDIIDIRRNLSSDQLIFNNQLFQCVSGTEWIGIDGWVAVLCVYVGDNDDNNKPIFGFNANPFINTYVNFYYGNFAIGADD